MRPTVKGIQLNEIQVFSYLISKGYRVTLLYPLQLKFVNWEPIDHDNSGGKYPAEVVLTSLLCPKRPTTEPRRHFRSVRREDLGVAEGRD
jgi:hypothetical protein